MTGFYMMATLALNGFKEQLIFTHIWKILIRKFRNLCRCLAMNNCTSYVFYLIVVLKIFANFTRKHLRRSNFLVRLNVQGRHFANIRTLSQIISCKFVRFWKACFLHVCSYDWFWSNYISHLTELANVS